MANLPERQTRTASLLARAKIWQGKGENIKTETNLQISRTNLVFDHLTNDRKSAIDRAVFTPFWKYPGF
ncbi:MAG: hypothetical protein VW417_01490 [Alphaproteobacteria bacterium]